MARFLKYLAGTACFVSFFVAVSLLGVGNNYWSEWLVPHTEVFGFDYSAWLVAGFACLFMWALFSAVVAAQTAAMGRDRALRKADLLEKILREVLERGGNTAFREAQDKLREIVRKSLAQRRHNLEESVAAVRALLETSAADRGVVDAVIAALDLQVDGLKSAIVQEAEARDALIGRADALHDRMLENLPIGWYTSDEREGDFLDFEDGFDEQKDRLQKLKEFLDENHPEAYIETIKALRALVEKLEAYEDEQDLSSIGSDLESLVDDLVSSIPGLEEDFSGFSFEVDTDAADEQIDRANDAITTFKEGVGKLIESLRKLQRLAEGLSALKKSGE